MVDEMKAFNILSEMVIEIRELRISVTKLKQENIFVEKELQQLKEELAEREEDKK